MRTICGSARDLEEGPLRLAVGCSRTRRHLEHWVEGAEELPDSLSPSFLWPAAAPQSSPYTLPAPCMHLGSECRVRPEALSQAPPSGRLASGAGPLTRSRPGGHATLLCHMPPPALAQHTLPHHTGCTPGATTPPPGAHHHTTHGRPRGTGHHTRSKSRPNRPPPPAPPHDGAQWGTRLDVPRRAGESHADRCRRTREPHGAQLARHSRRVAPSHQ